MLQAQSSGGSGEGQDPGRAGFVGWGAVRSGEALSADVEGDKGKNAGQFGFDLWFGRGIEVLAGATFGSADGAFGGKGKTRPQNAITVKNDSGSQ